MSELWGQDTYRLLILVLTSSVTNLFYKKLLRSLLQEIRINNIFCGDTNYLELWADA